jgi:hypothetical protein
MRLNDRCSSRDILNTRSLEGTALYPGPVLGRLLYRMLRLTYHEEQMLAKVGQSWHIILGEFNTVSQLIVFHTTHRIV